MKKLKKAKIGLFLAPVALLFATTSCNFSNIGNIVNSNKTPISLEATPNRTFYVGDLITINDFNVVATFDDNTRSSVTGAVIVEKQIDTSKAGITDVHISFTQQGKTVEASITITIVEKASSVVPVRMIATNTNVYYVGDVVRASDFVVIVYYSDGSYQTVNNAYLKGTVDTTHEGNVKVRIYYSSANVEVSFDVTLYINPKSVVVPISIEAHPKHDFFVGDNVTINDFTVHVTYSDSTEHAVYDAYITNDVDTSNPGEVPISISYTSNGTTVGTITYITIKSNKSLDYITASANKTFYVGYSIKISDFTVYAYFSDKTSSEVDDAYLINTPDTSFAGKKTVKIGYTYNYVEKLLDYDIEVLEAPTDYLTRTFNPYNESIWPDSYYSTGNYFAYDDYEFYRAVKNGSDGLRLLPCNDTNMIGLGGSMYNTYPIKDIYSITISYNMSGMSDNYYDPSRLYYGENNYHDNYLSIPYSDSTRSMTFTLNGDPANYFLISSGSTILNIEEVSINYFNKTTTHGYSFVNEPANEGSYRIAPTTFSGSLVDGESYVDFPTAFDKNNCTVLSTKRYYYYSYEYISNNPNLASSVALTDPVDVCNYFEAFGCAPCNYGSNSSFYLKDGNYVPSIYEVNNLFGSKARQISRYSRTDGYANSVPYYGYPPVYYELDIDLDGSYSTSNRQTGRVVAWSTGFSASGYDSGNQCVCVYTNDHYSTFREYNNFGGFMPVFSATRRIAGATWSNPITLEVKDGSDILEGAILLDYSECDAAYYLELMASSKYHIYLLQSGEIYILEAKSTFPLTYISGNRYFMTVSNQNGFFIDIDIPNAKITNPVSSPSAEYISGKYEEVVETSTATVESGYEFVANALTNLGYVPHPTLGGNGPEQIDNDSLTGLYRYFINNNLNIVAEAYSLDVNNYRKVIGCYFYQIDSNGNAVGALEEIPEVLINAATAFSLAIGGTSNNVNTDDYQSYGGIVYVEMPNKGETIQTTQTLATFTLGDGMVKMTVDYPNSEQPITLDFYLTYSVDEDFSNIYYVYTPFGTNFKLTKVNNSLQVELVK